MYISLVFISPRMAAREPVLLVRISADEKSLCPAMLKSRNTETFLTFNS